MNMHRNVRSDTLDGLHKESLGAVASRSGNAQERIRALAYAVWEDRVRSGEPGDELSDWLAAEKIAAGPRRRSR